MRVQLLVLWCVTHKKEKEVEPGSLESIRHLVRLKVISFHPRLYLHRVRAPRRKP